MKKRLSIPLLLGAAGLVYALWGSPPALVPQDPVVQDSEAPVPDSYARTVSVRRYAADGTLLEETDARSLRRYRVNGVAGERVELEAPQRRGHEGDQGWIASAERGEYRDGREALRLSGDVRLRYTLRDIEFLTQEMVIRIDQQTARSLTPVRAWQADNETTANRLFVNLDREVAVLSGDVRSVYQPAD